MLSSQGKSLSPISYPAGTNFVSERNSNQIRNVFPSFSRETTILDSGNKRVIFTIVSVPIYYIDGRCANSRATNATGPFPVGHYTISRADEEQQAAAEFISASCILSQCNQVSTSLRPPPLLALFSHHDDTSLEAAAAAQHPHDFHFSLSSGARGGPQSYGEPFIRVICHAFSSTVSFPTPRVEQKERERERIARFVGVISSPWPGIPRNRVAGGSR